jgi:hypothetical protein
MGGLRSLQGWTAFTRHKLQATYSEARIHFHDRLESQRLTRYYVKRLERLGHKVTLETIATA